MRAMPVDMLQAAVSQCNSFGSQRRHKILQGATFSPGVLDCIYSQSNILDVGIMQKLPAWNCRKHSSGDGPRNGYVMQCAVLKPAPGTSTDRLLAKYLATL